MSFLYTPYYCEENVWHLCQREQFVDSEPIVVFVGNEIRACPLWYQRASSLDQPVLWDYHVFLLCRDADFYWQVWDLDTLLGFPVNFEHYVDRTFGKVLAGDVYAPNFRLIAAQEYQRVFSSDRAHMRDKSGAWLEPPPPWPFIYNGVVSNLMEMTDFQAGRTGGVLGLAEFRARFAQTVWDQP